jgi:hypothetical protein
MRTSVGLLMLTGCMPQQLPPPAAPEPVIAEVAAVPTAPGKGQATLDADEPSTVMEDIGSTPFTDDDGNTLMSPIYKTVCAATPCVTNLDFGAHDLQFTSNVDALHSGTGTLTVGEQPIDYRFALGHNDPSPHFATGLTTTIAGAALMFGGMFAYGITQQPGGFAPSSSWGTAGIVSFAVGIAALAVGVHLLADPGTMQNGTGTQWTPAPG